MVMPSNSSGTDIGILAERYKGRIGHLYSPGGQRGPWPEIPYALDNGAYAAWEHGLEWSESEWRFLLNWAALSGIPPIWVLVPDVVADRAGTLARWSEYAPVVAARGWRAAFAVQDGMTFEDVPDSTCVVFLGGSDAFKEAAIAPWCAAFPGRVHVGRVNGWDRLVRCWRAGAVSVDGTRLFQKGRGGEYSQAAMLRKFLRETASARGEETQG